MKGIDLIDALRKAIEDFVREGTDEEVSITDKDVSRVCGYANIGQIKNAKVTPGFIVNLVKRTRGQSAENARRTAIRTVVEFFPVTKCKSKQGAKFEIFVPTEHDYLEGLYRELKDTKGVYVFFDSRGKAVYVGSTKRKNLWDEMKSAFNRDRNTSVQQVFRVKHPARKQEYKSSDEKSRQIKKQGVQLHELACYFSAYQVHKDMIGTIEALLIRTSANDLLNDKMENVAKK